MAKYTGPVCRLCRREGQKLFLKGERCMTDRCSIDRKSYPPGQHGQRRSKLSEFAIQLREKQKVKRVYNVLERQFRNIFKKASQTKGVTADIFFRNLELRADNVVFRMGFARSRAEGRQVVRHNHILLNGKRMNIPSATLKLGDTVTVEATSAKDGKFALAADLFKKRPVPPWVAVDHESFSGKVTALPTRDDIQLQVKERLIVELYNK